MLAVSPARVRWPSEAFRWPQDGPRGVQENPKTALRQFFFSFGGIGTKSALHLAGTRQRAKCAASVNNQNEETEIFCITKQWKYSTEIFCITRPWKSSTEIFCITRPWKSSTEIFCSTSQANFGSSEIFCSTSPWNHRNAAPIWHKLTLSLEHVCGLLCNINGIFCPLTKVLSLDEV